MKNWPEFKFQETQCKGTIYVQIGHPDSSIFSFEQRHVKKLRSLMHIIPSFLEEWRQKEEKRNF